MAAVSINAINSICYKDAIRTGLKELKNILQCLFDIPQNLLDINFLLVQNKLGEANNLTERHNTQNKMSETITITLSASLEDYLEAIFHTVKENKVARVKDIAKILKVNNSSVTGALQSLTKKGLINYQPYEIITLTPEGESLARDISNRHHVLQQFLLEILALDQE